MAECTTPLGAAECLKLVAGGALDSAVDSGASSMGEAMMGGWDSLMKQFLTSWLDVGLLVSLEGDSVAWLTSQLQVISVFFAIIGIMIAALWTMIHFRGDKAVGVAKALLTVMLVTTLGTAIVQLVINVGDIFSDWVLDSAGVTVSGVGNTGTITQTALTISPGLAIIAGIFGIIATGIQWLIMLIRATLLPLLVAVWPLAASASMINGSEQAFSKLTKWMIAFILYKPVAAIVYAFAWRLKSGDDGLGGVLNGLLLLILAIVALPALMRLISPGTSALGGAAGGSMALAAGAAVGSAAVSAGAAIMTGGGSAAATAGTAGGGAATAGGAAAAGGGGGAPATAGGAPTTPAVSGGPAETPSASADGVVASGGGTEDSADTSSAPAAPGTSDSSGADAGAAEGAPGTAGPETSGAAEGTTGGPSSDAPGNAGAAQGTPAAEGTPGTTGPETPGAAEGTTAGPSSDAPGNAGAAQGTPAAEGIPAADAPAPSGPSGGSSKGSAAARAATDRLGSSVADGAKDVNGEDVIGG